MSSPAVTLGFLLRGDFPPEAAGVVFCGAFFAAFWAAFFAVFLGGVLGGVLPEDALLGAFFLAGAIKPAKRGVKPPFEKRLLS
ncbi:hypothetical protein GSUB_06125 [Geoalkalibacter subterraneus]|uniref:Uncharacterized protein n=1 Tax=Geoalkalibacter subterraneus TaxID=483547 RepID=A0A0B5FNJ8_9BACT|nr:hypothetical protein GSUB_06125 [Geoalkalibacter subterraneus]